MTSRRVSLRDYVDAIFEQRDVRFQQRFEAQEKSLAAALTAIRESTSKSEVSIDHRLDLLNHLREGVATVAEVNAVHDRVTENRSRLERLEGAKAGLQAGWGYLIAILALALTFYATLHR